MVNQAAQYAALAGIIALVLVISNSVLGILKPILEQYVLRSTSGAAHDNTLRGLGVAINFALICGILATQHQFAAQSWWLYLLYALGQQVPNHVVYAISNSGPSDPSAPSAPSASSASPSAVDPTSLATQIIQQALAATSAPAQPPTASSSSPVSLPGAQPAPAAASSPAAV